MKVRVTFLYKDTWLLAENFVLASWESVASLNTEDTRVLSATLIDEDILLSHESIAAVVFTSNTTSRLFQRLYDNPIVQHLKANHSYNLRAFIETQLKGMETGKRLEKEPEVLAAITLLSLDLKNYDTLEELSELKYAELGAIPRLAKYCLKPLEVRLRP